MSDFLIAPRDLAAGRGKPHTRPGDSGAVWHLVTRPDGRKPENTEDEFVGTYRPLAIEWGGQVFLGGTSAQRFTFGLATSLTTVCQSLNVELVLEHNVGALPYWGQVGHYSIGKFACGAIPDAGLKSFFNQYAELISFTVGELDADVIKARLKQIREDEGIIPLADVPDLVWKKYYKDKDGNLTGGRDTRFIGQGRTTGPEHPTHYADIDEERADGKSLIQLCLAEDANISVAFWQQFYDGLEHTEEHERGLLPFRVWQFFDSMVDAAKDKDPERFLCAAGLLAHYVGDACQPLHGSIYADGYPGGDGKGVHSTYETKMIDRYAEDLVEGDDELDGITQRIKKWKYKGPQITTGHAAAKATIQLMSRAAKRLPPKKIVDAYIAAGAKPVVAVQDALWEKFGDKTIETMVDGASVLAQIWAGAWIVGNGKKIAKTRLQNLDLGVVKDAYEDRNFVESLNLDQIGAVLRP